MDRRATLSAQLGQPIVIESRPGAGGVIGTAAVAKADPDGHTILLTASSYTISPWANANLPYDTVNDLARITPLANLPMCSWSRRRRTSVGAGARRGGASESRRAQLCVRRRRQRDPPQRRALPVRAPD